ncbi:hypothetical protein EAKF1_ch4537c [Escherichia albertii KF1]|nr:hypothetical protein EAKF1_ch4537c [Escherichia albertii KF1]
MKTNPEMKKQGAGKKEINKEKKRMATSDKKGPQPLYY